jgi:hypothetical protein
MGVTTPRDESIYHIYINALLKIFYPMVWKLWSLAKFKKNHGSLSRTGLLILSASVGQTVGLAFFYLWFLRPQQTFFQCRLYLFRRWLPIGWQASIISRARCMV